MFTICSTCRFAAVFHAGEGIYECRRRSPSPELHPFPLTHAQNWCGEWESRSDSIKVMTLSATEIEVLFRTWWGTSYPTPPGPHSLMTHVGWGLFLQQHLAENGGARTNPPEVER